MCLGYRQPIEREFDFALQLSWHGPTFLCRTVRLSITIDGPDYFVTWSKLVLTTVPLVPEETARPT